MENELNLITYGFWVLDEYFGLAKLELVSVHID